MSGWFLELYDKTGERRLAEDGHTFESIVVAVRARAPGETMRFIPPVSAHWAQLEALRRLGSRPT
jgi:hypothetical protein